MKVSTKAFNIFTALAVSAAPRHAALANQEGRKECMNYQMLIFLHDNTFAN